MKSKIKTKVHRSRTHLSAHSTLQNFWNEYSTSIPLESFVQCPRLLDALALTFKTQSFKRMMNQKSPLVAWERSGTISRVLDFFLTK